GTCRFSHSRTRPRPVPAPENWPLARSPSRAPLIRNFGAHDRSAGAMPQPMILHSYRKRNTGRNTSRCVCPTLTLPRRRGGKRASRAGGGFRLENRRRNSALLLALGHFLEFFLKLVEALGQVLDGAVVAGGLRGARGCGGWRRRGRALRHAGHGASGEGREHLRGLFEQREVLLAHFLERAEREQAAERVLKAFAHLFLVAGKARHRLFEIARH